MKNNFLPGFLHWILCRIIDRVEHYSFVGDFEEIFREIAEEKGIIAAYIWYVCQIFKIIPGFVFNSIYRGTKMFKNYIKIALRSLSRQKGFSFINISGLAIGLSCCFLILLWIQFETSYDRFHDNRDNIYKLICKGEQILNNYDGTPGPAGPASVEQIPGVKNYVRLMDRSRKLFMYDNKTFYENGGLIAEKSFFEIFSFPLLKGDPVSALDNPNSIVISETMAERYFSDEDPIGKVISDEGAEYIVGGVMKNFPDNSHMDINYFLSFSILNESDSERWGGFNFITYLLLEEGTDPVSVGESLTEIARENNTYQVKKRGVSLVLEPLLKVHLYDKNSYRGWVDIGNIAFVYTFSAASIVILLIACANFINLSTARSALRSKEVGIRKTIGAYRKQLVKQFFAESILLTFIASCTAVLLSFAALPIFNSLFNLDLSFSILNYKFAFAAIGVVLITGIISGIYPAMILSGFNPTQVLKGNTRSIIKGSGFRRVMVVFQFSLSIILVICSAIIYSQLNYVNNKNLGFNTEQIIYIPMKGEIHKQYNAVKNEMLNNSNIEMVSGQIYSFAETQWWSNSMDWEGKDPERTMSFIWNMVDFDFFEMMNIEMIEGRSFSKDFSTDKKEAFILNETAVTEMGIELPVVGKTFSFRYNGERNEGKIIGIVKDVHFKSLHDEIAPHLFLVMDNPEVARNMGTMLIKYNSGNSTELENVSSDVLEHVKNVWTTFNPSVPFEYKFLDESYARFYVKEVRTGNMIKYFTYFALIVSCLGLFGLSSFIAERRTKEIGIRKTLGASISSIVSLTTREFLVLVAIANVIAWPAGYYIMNKWMTMYAYKSDIGMTIFFLAGFFSFLIAFFSVSFQSIKAANANPVNSLRYE